MFLGVNNTRLERKIRIFLDFENGFLPTYLPLCSVFLQIKADYVTGFEMFWKRIYKKMQIYFCSSSGSGDIWEKQ